MRIDSRLVKRIRKEFPAAEADPAGRPRAFLDNGAGTLVTMRSAEREAMARIDWCANVGNLFPESLGAEETILEGRQAVSDLLGASGPDTILSGESATSLLFNLSYAMGREFTGEENVVTTGYEHYTNINPWVELGEEERIMQLRFAEFDRDTGRIDLETLSDLVDGDTKVVSVSAASNVLGTRTDLKEVGKIARDAGAYFIVDAVHHIAHGATDVRAIKCDALVFSGYKLFSRHGSFMYLSPELIEGLTPYKVLPSPKHGPEKWEWGTRDQAMFAAAAGAIDYVAWVGDPSAKRPPSPGKQRRARLLEAFEAIEEYEKTISDLVLNGRGKLRGLLDIPGLTLYGPPDTRGKMGRDPTFSFKVDGWDDRKLSKLLWDKYALAVGAEDYFSRVPALYEAETMLRATFVHYNTEQEAMSLLRALNEVAERRR
ncbi:MAG: aminotransferase class V-fold PLP-dependent enzyme [Candidatus Thermoplasmatota archaeon]